MSFRLGHPLGDEPFAGGLAYVWTCRWTDPRPGKHRGSVRHPTTGGAPHRQPGKPAENLGGAGSSGGALLSRIQIQGERQRGGVSTPRELRHNHREKPLSNTRVAPTG